MMMLLWMPKVHEWFLCGDGAGIVSFGAGIVSVRRLFIQQYVFS